MCSRGYDTFDFSKLVVTVVLQHHMDLESRGGSRHLSRRYESKTLSGSLQPLTAHQRGNPRKSISPDRLTHQPPFSFDYSLAVMLTLLLLCNMPRAHTSGLIFSLSYRYSLVTPTWSANTESVLHGVPLIRMPGNARVRRDVSLPGEWRSERDQATEVEQYKGVITVAINEDKYMNELSSTCASSYVSTSLQKCARERSSL